MTHIHLTDALTGLGILVPIAGAEFGAFLPPKQPTSYNPTHEHQTFEAQAPGFDWTSATHFNWFRSDGEDVYTAAPLRGNRQPDIHLRILISADDPRRLAAFAAYVEAENASRAADWITRGGRAHCEVITARGAKYLVMESLVDILRLLREAAIQDVRTLAL